MRGSALAEANCLIWKRKADWTAAGLAEGGGRGGGGKWWAESSLSDESESEENDGGEQLGVMGAEGWLGLSGVGYLVSGVGYLVSGVV